ncbi:hypothetical protein ACTXT7_007128 [Hymenolepis weldensis]
MNEPQARMSIPKTVNEPSFLVENENNIDDTNDCQEVSAVTKAGPLATTFSFRAHLEPKLEITGSMSYSVRRMVNGPRPPVNHDGRLRGVKDRKDKAIKRGIKVADLVAI